MAGFCADISLKTLTKILLYSGGVFDRTSVII